MQFIKEVISTGTRDYFIARVAEDLIYDAAEKSRIYLVDEADHVIAK